MPLNRIQVGNAVALALLGWSLACSSESLDGATSSGTGASGGTAAAAAGGAAGSSAEAGGARGCSTVRAELLGSVDRVSAGAVEDVSELGAASTTLRVDASAGGYQAAREHPYVYVTLSERRRVDVTDLQGDESTAWDLAFKRDNVRANGGDSGPGSAAVAALPGADFDSVTSLEAAGAVFSEDDFIDEQTCEAVVDAIGKPVTELGGWYLYDEDTMTLAPADVIYLIRGADGASVYKLQFLDYYVELHDPVAGAVQQSGVYTLRFAAL